MDYVLDLAQLGAADVALAGGKGANLGELTRLDGVRVPDGFCVTTDAYREAADASRYATQEPEELPEALVAEVAAALARNGEHAAYAVRSSATAEDLPTASFAGQQDSYLNVTGLPEILRHIRLCWASLFTERAIAYRERNGIGEPAMAVVVQRMVEPDAAGVLFTADPVTGHRGTATVEAVGGLADRLVSGLVNGQAYAMRDDRVITAPDGDRLLTDEQVLRLVRLGRRVEAHFGRPQDIEWCLAGGEFHLVQSRPITTLFPLPESAGGENRVCVSVGHQQMMTDAIKPLGLSVWQATTPRPMHEAGGRLFVDVAPLLARPSGRAYLLDTLGRSDPLIRDALRTLLDRGFVPELPDDGAPPPAGAPAPGDPDPGAVTELIAENEASVERLRQEIERLSGPELIDFVVADFAELRRLLFDPRSHQLIMAGMEAAWWLTDHLEEWLGERDAAGALTQSVPHNVTSEMGLALLDVADAIRPHPEVVAFLRRVADLSAGAGQGGSTGEGPGAGADRFLDELAGLPGGREARDALAGFLASYGMRCPGEIDITRPRWAENPAALLLAILGNVRNFPPGEATRRFEQGLREAERAERDLLERLRELPGGEQKAAETERMIRRVRAFAGYREYPKYGMVRRYFLYKQALLREADRLVRDGVLGEREDVFYLRLDELREVVRTRRADRDLIGRRREEFRSYETLTPPRVMTSDGEVVTGRYRHDGVPPGALAGLGVSAGVAEGRARVVTDLARAELEPGDILVTPYTDPSWTPLFVAAAGLVTEVGGLMTHGAVIAREYGLPAVVGVEGATRLVRDGQRIRVDGTGGHVEIIG